MSIIGRWLLAAIVVTQLANGALFLWLTPAPPVFARSLSTPLVATAVLALAFMLANLAPCVVMAGAMYVAERSVSQRAGALLGGVALGIELSAIASGVLAVWTR